MVRGWTGRGGAGLVDHGHQEYGVRPVGVNGDGTDDPQALWCRLDARTDTPHEPRGRPSLGRLAPLSLAARITPPRRSPSACRSGPASARRPGSGSCSRPWPRCSPSALTPASSNRNPTIPLPNSSAGNVSAFSSLDPVMGQEPAAVHQARPVGLSPETVAALGPLGSRPERHGPVVGVEAELHVGDSLAQHGDGGGGQDHLTTAADGDLRRLRLGAGALEELHAHRDLLGFGGASSPLSWP